MPINNALSGSRSSIFRFSRSLDLDFILIYSKV